MKRVLILLIGLCGMLVGVGLILPALAKARDFGSMPTSVVLPYTLGVLLAFMGLCLSTFTLARELVRLLKTNH